MRPSPDQFAGCARFGCGAFLGGVAACLTVLQVWGWEATMGWMIGLIALNSLLCGFMAWRRGDRYLEKLVAWWGSS